MSNTSLITATAPSNGAVPESSDVLILPLRGLGLPISRGWQGALTGEEVRAALRRRIIPPAIDLGIPFSPDGGGFASFTCLDRNLEEQREPTEPMIVLNDNRVLYLKHLRSLLPRLRLPGDSDRFSPRHVDELVTFLLPTDFRTAIPAGLTLQDPDVPPVYYEEKPIDRPITRKALLKFVSGFPGADRVLRAFSSALGGKVRAIDPQQASAAATRLFGIPLDMRRGILVPSGEALWAMRFAYGRTPLPAEVDDFFSHGIRRVRAAHVQQWGGGVFADAVWSCDLDVALNGPEYLRDWLARQKEPHTRLN